MPPIADILSFALLPLIAVGAAFHFATSPAGRAHPAPPALAVGSAIAATVCAFLLVFLPGEAYSLGLKGLVPLLLLWLLFPFLAWNILPGITGPSLGSPLAYLQRRFDGRTAIPATVVYLLGRGVLSAVVLATMARMLSTATHGWLSPLVIAFLLGISATACSAACGRRGGTWLNVWLLVGIGVGLPLAIATVVTRNGDAGHLWEVGQSFQRTWIADPRIDLADSGVVWNLVPFLVCALLVLLLGDDATAARLAQLHAPARVREAFVSLLILLSMFGIAVMYLGVGVFVFYQKHPGQTRPKWIINVDPYTRLSMTDPATQLPLLDPATGQPIPSFLGDGVRRDRSTGTPLLPWDEADITAEDLPDLIRAGRIYHPNSRQPIGSVADILDRSGERIDFGKIAGYSLPEHHGRPSEMLLHRRASEELWPYFVSTQAPVGVRGLLLAGLLAAAFAACDMTAVIGSPALRTLLPLRNDASERVLSALASLGVMLLATLLSFLVTNLRDLALYALAASLTPIAGTVLLGLTSRRANPGVALAALVVGVGSGISLSLIISRDPAMSLHPMWSVSLTLLATFAMGQLLAVVFGDFRRRGELRGLVLGTIPIGAIRDEEATLEIEVPQEREAPNRWR